MFNYGEKNGDYVKKGCNCMSFESLSKCVHSCVLPIIEYGTEITCITGRWII